MVDDDYAMDIIGHNEIFIQFDIMIFVVAGGHKARPYMAIDIFMII
ncbi:hypothetical protein ACFL6W_03145 [Thermodesulfobacteriota bacterium]